MKQKSKDFASSEYMQGYLDGREVSRAFYEAGGGRPDWTPFWLLLAANIIVANGFGWWWVARVVFHA